MTTQIKRRRGTAAEHTSFTGADAELTVNTTNKSVHVHDGTTVGGHELARADGSNVGNFDVTGTVTADGLTVDGVIDVTSTTSLSTNLQNTGGSALLPTYSFNGSADVGMYCPSVNNLGLVTGQVERIRIDSSGNVGIGVTPSAWGTAKAIQVERASISSYSSVQTDYAQNAFYDGSNWKYIATDEANKLTLYNGEFRFFTAASGTAGNAITFDQAMTLDASGNLLVKATSLNIANTGHGFGAYAYHTRSGEPVLYVNRTTSDGSIIEFRKDNASVGSIGAERDDLYIGTGDVGLFFNDASDRIDPFNTTTLVERDNFIDLGGPGSRFTEIYATNGTIQTSDRNEKQDIEELTEAEQRVAVAAKGLLRKFRWIDSVEEKGDDARIHFGIIAQDLQAAFEAEGLDAGRYAMFIHSTWTDEETGEERSRMGVRYSELLAFIIVAI